MALNLLLVEDEPGIREGLASFLQLKGHRVVTAQSCEDGLRHIADNDFDVVITDWHLGDGLGETVVTSCGCPVLVISGVTELVDVPGVCVEVIRKPVAPRELLARIEAIVAPRSEVAHETSTVVLPIDAHDRVELMRALVTASQPSGRNDWCTVADDGTFVTVRAVLAEDDPDLQSALLRICSDVRCLENQGRPMLEARFFRDGRRDAEDVALHPLDEWPDDSSALAIDFHDASHCAPERIAQLVQMATAAAAAGRVVYFTNLPGYLRLHLELLGNVDAMPAREPIREMAGPLLPAVLTELWR